MFFILLLLILLILIILNSKVEISIYNLDISTERAEKIKKDYKICLYIIIFNKIKILKFNLQKIKNPKINWNEILKRAQNLKDNQAKNLSTKELIKSLKNLELKIIKANLKLELGTKDSAKTAILLGSLAGLLGILLKKQKFEVLPIYQDRNILKIKLNCIIRMNLIHYIYKNILKERKNNEKKSSHRRTYAYSDE